MTKRLPKVIDHIPPDAPAPKTIGHYAVGQIVDYVDMKRLAAAAAASDRHWHLVHCVGRTEAATIDWLTKFKIETYRPTLRAGMRKVPRRELPLSKRDQVIYQPMITSLFPRYVFTKINLAARDWEHPFKIAGVVGIVYNGNEPLRVSDKDLAHIRRLEVQSSIPGDTQAKLIFEVGEQVRVNEGPFTGFNATVQKRLEMPLLAIAGDERIKLAVAIFSRATPAELFVSQVEKL